MGVTCFWLEPADRVLIGLRRYSRSSGESARCPESRIGVHEAMTPLGGAPIRWTSERGTGASHWLESADGSYGVPDFSYPPHGDSHWPSACASCGTPFREDDPWQEWSDRLYRRADNGAMTTLRAAPDGAMWDAHWYPWKGPDGRSLMVKCPGGGEWSIDGRASNCTLPGDSEHRCWVRHGEPPVITVDKNGLTCGAGAGSIVAGDYHGFLRNGVFEP